MSRIIRPTLDELLRHGYRLNRREFFERTGRPLTAATVGLSLANPWNSYASQQEEPQEIVFLNPRPSLDEIVSAGTRKLTIFIDTKTNADLRWEHASRDTPYEEMRFPFTNTGGTRHSTEIPGLSDGNKYYIFIKGRNRETGIESIVDYVMTFSVSTDRIPVEGNVPVIGIFSKAGAGNGGLFLQDMNNLQIPTVKSHIMIRKDDRVFPGKYNALLQTDIGEDRYFPLIVTPTEIYVDKAGGRKETTITVIERDPRVGIEDWREFERYMLRLRRIQGSIMRVSARIDVPFTIGILDQYTYSREGGTGRLIREGPYTLNETTRESIYNTFRHDNFASFWTNGLYPDGDLTKTKYFRVQSMGHEIPENERSPGWIIFYQYKDIPRGRWIDRTDSAGYVGTGPVILWAGMGLNPYEPIPQIHIKRDTKQSWGPDEVSDAPYEIDSDRQSPKMGKYLGLYWNRPPGWGLPDRQIQIPNT